MKLSLYRDVHLNGIVIDGGASMSSTGLFYVTLFPLQLITGLCYSETLNDKHTLLMGFGKETGEQCMAAV